MTDAFLWVADVDRLYEELSARGAVVQLPPTDQTWGIREMGIREPDGKRARLCHKTSEPECGLTMRCCERRHRVAFAIGAPRGRRR